MLTVPSSYISPATVDLLRSGKQLPPGYGVMENERCVEYPFFLAALPQWRGGMGGRMLDAGSTLNHQEILDLPWLNDWTLHILSAAPEQYSCAEKGIFYLYEDLRRIPIQDEYYDAVVCLSVLEHIGKDNSLHYGGKKENDPDAFLVAMREMVRVLRPGGTFLLTVPYGTYQDGGWFQNFDRWLLERALSTITGTPTVEIFAATPSGWQRVEESTEYYRSHQGRAGSVACVKVIKEG